EHGDRARGPHAFFEPFLPGEARPQLVLVQPDAQAPAAEEPGDLFDHRLVLAVVAQENVESVRHPVGLSRRLGFVPRCLISKFYLTPVSAASISASDFPIALSRAR